MPKRKSGQDAHSRRVSGRLAVQPSTPSGDTRRPYARRSAASASAGGNVETRPVAPPRIQSSTVGNPQDRTADRKSISSAPSHAICQTPTGRHH